MILDRLVSSRHVLGHLLNEVLGEPRMTRECVNDVLGHRVVELLPGDLGNNFVAESIPSAGWGCSAAIVTAAIPAIHVDQINCRSRDN